MLELYVKIKKCSTEALFTSDWLKKLKLKGFWAHKISDWWIWLKPFDWIIQTNINNYFFEAKRIEKDIFKLNQIRENQRASFHKISNIENKCEIYSLKQEDILNLKNKSCLLVIFQKDTENYIIIPFVELALLWYNSKIKIDFDNKKYTYQ